MKAKKIKDCLPLVNGIWSKIDYQFPEIFDIDASQLDILFLSHWSMRTAAPILNVIHTDEDTSMLTDAELTTLANMIKGIYKHRWDKLMAVAEMEYDPIHNYHDHLVESVEYSEDVDGSRSGSGTTSKNDTETHNMNNSGTSSNQDNVYGFNSSTAVGEANNSRNTSNLESGTITDVQSGTSSNSETSSNDTTGERSREYTKTGNIGNISTQKLLNEEIDLWKYNFIHEIMRDVANFVSLPIYEQ